MRFCALSGTSACLSSRSGRRQISVEKKYASLSPEVTQASPLAQSRAFPPAQSLEAREDQHHGQHLRLRPCWAPSCAAAPCRCAAALAARPAAAPRGPDMTASRRAGCASGCSASCARPWRRRTPGQRNSNPSSRRVSRSAPKPQPSRSRSAARRCAAPCSEGMRTATRSPGAVGDSARRRTCRRGGAQ